MTQPNTAYIGIGSNLGDSKAIVKGALADLNDHADIHVEKVSSYYITDPVGGVEQDQFINAVFKLTTSLDAHRLLNVLHQLEQKYKRVRTIHWGPRTLDLDIELFNTDHIQTTELIVPHKEMFNRLFVLVPLLEIIDPDDQRVPQIKAAIAKLSGSQYIKKLD
ncbi:MAG: 2-amino-4-hydroxy-6-hydroxymethyldihydropteridine diphosphokinase [Lentilactobacillus diolivorans]|uniref:2-amino-4-hydroxy-6- hydroxymethyldihydropteridine diphosphokinase n=1 Tax=Lentilactobacillus diolivorans TaxID=179838 RepID=UPI0039EA5868